MRATIVIPIHFAVAGGDYMFSGDEGLYEKLWIALTDALMPSWRLADHRYFRNGIR